VLERVHFGTTWRIRLNCPCAAAMQPFCQITLTTFIVNIIRLHRSYIQTSLQKTEVVTVTKVRRCGLLLHRPSSVVCRSIYLSITLVSPAETAEPIEMPFGLWIGWAEEAQFQSYSPCSANAPSWRRLANTIEPSVCGGDSALCQITLSTCYYSCCCCRRRCNLIDVKNTM